MGGAVLCLVLMLFSMPEGPGQIFEIAAAHDKFSLGSFDPLEFTTATFWVVLVYGIFINLNNFGIDQNYVQRYAAARSVRDAAKSLWLGALLYVPVSAVFFFIGTSLFAYYTSEAGALPPEIVEHVEVQGTGDYVFPYYIVTRLPAGVTGLLIAAIFAAAMSTVSTSLNSSATILLTDVYRRYLKPEATERESMMFLYGSTLVCGILGILVGMAMIRAEGVLDTWWEIQGVFAGGMLGLFLLGMISRRVQNPGAIAGVVAGVLVIAWLSMPSLLGDAVPEAIRNPLHGNLTIIIGTATILVVGLLVTSFIGPRREESNPPEGK
jgi:SSS family solute:Na+ symporter